MLEQAGIGWNRMELAKTGLNWLELPGMARKGQNRLEQDVIGWNRLAWLGMAGMAGKGCNGL